MLRLDHASVVYPNGVRGLDGASLAFERGLFVALLGPSGAGKSSLLRCLNGLVRLSRGDVLGSDNRSIFASGPALRRHRRQTAMIFQQHHLIGRLTALQNVLIGRLAFHSPLQSLLPPSRAERRRALEALDRVELLDRALSRADQLSGGEQQRVGIARALVQSPQTILADEPVASLDPATASRVLELIHCICREDNITVIASLHQVELARHFAGRLIGLSSGRIVFDGPASQLNASAMQRIYGMAGPLPAATETSRQPTEESGHESPSPAISRRRRDARHRHLGSGAG